MPIANADALGEGETLRIDLGGTIIAIVRADGALYGAKRRGKNCTVSAATRTADAPGGG